MNYAFIHTLWSLPVFQRYDLVLRIDTDLGLMTGERRRRG